MALIAAAGIGLSVLAYFLLADDDGGSSQTPPGQQASMQEDPAPMAWEPTGRYRTEQFGIGLTAHAYSISPSYIAILYSVDHSSPGLSASPDDISLTDDLGQSYSIVSNTILGTSLGVTAGVLTAEPYKGEGESLTLSVTNVAAATDGGDRHTVPGTWSIVAFIENRAPGAPIDYFQGGRIFPEVMSAGDLTMAVAGPPGDRFVKLLIDRAGEQAALYGLISNGVGQALSEVEFHQLLQAELDIADFPPPYDFPAPATTITP